MNLTPFDHITYIIHLKFDTVMLNCTTLPFICLHFPVLLIKNKSKKK